MSKKILGVVLASIVALSSLNVVYAADNEGAVKKITIIHTNDTHGRIEENEKSGILGFAKISSYIKSLKKENPNTLVVDAGDTVHGMPILNVSKGKNAIKILDSVGYDFMAPGNHDFNYGQDVLLNLSKEAKFEMLSANIVDKKGTYVYTPYKIVEMDGLKIGIFGLTTPETAYKTSPTNVKDITFLDPIEASKKMVAELKDKTDIIVALSHVGLDESSVVTTKKIAQDVKDLDVIIDGHSHTKLDKGLVVGDTLIAQTGEYDANVGVVNLEVTNGKVTKKEAKLVNYEAVKALAPDIEVVKTINEINEANKSKLDKVVAKTDIDLDGARENVRTRETNLGNLSADAVRAAVGSEIAFVNGGNIRCSIPKGDITMGKIAELFPFGNTVVVKKIKGEDIVKALEVSVQGYPATQGGFLHVSGLTFSFDASKEKGHRVLEVQVAGKPLDKERVYTVAINDFLAIGGDGYEVLKGGETVAETGTYEEVIANYLNSNGTKGCEVTGRVAVKNDVKEEPKAEVKPVEVVKPVETVKPVKKEEAKVIVMTPVKEEAKVASEVTYTVQAHDTLWKIAKGYDTTWQEIASLNNLKNPNRIFPGQILKIPAKLAA